jgi:hypothetical protein
MLANCLIHLLIQLIQFSVIFCYFWVHIEKLFYHFFSASTIAFSQHHCFQPAPLLSASTIAFSQHQ